jgi:Domain of unknown function (DUF4436)
MIFVGLWAGTFVVHTSNPDKTEDFQLEEKEMPKDHIVVKISPTSLDPVKDTLKFKLDLEMHGKYLNEQTHTPAMPLAIVVPDTDPKRQEHAVKPGQKVKSIEVDVDIEGDINAYPHDHYETGMFVFIVDGLGQPVPTVLRYKDKISGMNSDPGIHEESKKDGYLALEVKVERTLEVRLYSWFINIMIAILALAVVGVSYLVIFADRKVEFGQMTWIGATLFVFVSMRNSQPAVPTFGTTLDVLIFFWAEVLTATSLVAIAITWMKRSKPG